MSDDSKNEFTDIQLLENIAKGDKTALSRLYDLYASHVLAVAFHILKNKQEAEDLVHDVFLEAWKKSASYDPKRGTVRNWLLLRTRSRSIDRIRKLAKTETRSEIEETDLTHINSVNHFSHVDPVQQLEHRQAQQAIDQLSPEHALLIKASYFEDLSYREIAKKYNIPEGTVKSRMLAAFKVLRKQLVSIDGGEQWIRT